MMHSNRNPVFASDSRRKRIRITLLVLPAAVLVLAALLFSRLLPVGRHNAFSTDGEPVLASAPAGGGLAAATDSSLRLFSVSGKCICSAESSGNSPIVSGSAVCAAFADTELTGITVLTPDGSAARADTDGPVRFLHVNKSGLITVITEKDGARGLVSCYDSRLTPLFSWEAHSGYPLCARLSDNGILAICCTSTGGGQLRLYDITEESERASYLRGDVLFLDFSFTANGRLALLTEDSLLFLSDRAEVLAGYPLAEQQVSAWCASDSLIAIAVPSGCGSEICAFRPDGTLLASVSSDMSVLALSAAGDSLLTTGPEIATLYDAALTELISCQIGKTVSRGYLTSGQTALFVGSGEVRRIRLGR